MLRFLSGLICLITVSISYASVDPQIDPYIVICDKFQGIMPGGFCVHLPVQNASGDYLYHFHGLGGSEKKWNDSGYYTSQLRKAWYESSAKLPVVISISFGQVWLLAEKNSSKLSGLFEYVRDKVIPQIEMAATVLSGVTPKRRLILGESMGGFNSVQFALKTNLFTKAAIICAPMATVSPFDTKEIIQAYIEKTFAWNYYKDDHKPVTESVNRMINLSRQFFPKPDEWIKGDPIVLSKIRRSFPKLYITAGTIDPYALFETNELFAKNLKSLGADVDWRPQWGGHCVIDFKSLSEFLIN